MAKTHAHEGPCDENCGGETITITYDDGTDVECAIVGTFDFEGKEYIALSQLTDEEILLFRCEEDGDELVINSIDDDGEYDRVANEFFENFEEDDEEGDFEDFDE
jgi:uncharacterized protein YrzB (UPF0473 family)